MTPCSGMAFVSLNERPWLKRNTQNRKCRSLTLEHNLHSSDSLCHLYGKCTHIQMMLMTQNLCFLFFFFVVVRGGFVCSVISVFQENNQHPHASESLCPLTAALIFTDIKPGWTCTAFICVKYVEDQDYVQLFYCSFLLNNF